MTKTCFGYQNLLFGEQIGDQKLILLTKALFLVTKIVTELVTKMMPKMKLVTKTENLTKFGHKICDQSRLLVTKSIWRPKPVFGDQNNF